MIDDRCPSVRPSMSFAVVTSLDCSLPRVWFLRFFLLAFVLLSFLRSRVSFDDERCLFSVPTAANGERCELHKGGAVVVAYVFVLLTRC